MLLLIAGLSSCGPDFESYEYEDVFNFPLNSSSEYIIVMGDVQDYTYYDYYAPYFMKTVNWIRGMYKKEYAIDCVLQTGDQTNTNEKWEYRVFYNYTKYMSEEVLFIPVTGNHDYDWHNGNKIIDRKSTRFNDYANFPNTRENIVQYYEQGRLENVIVKVPIRNGEIYILALEFAPRPEVVEWARQYVEKNNSKIFMLLTHEFLNHDGYLESTETSYARLQFEERPNSSPEEIWNKLIFPNDNIRAVICGHNVFSCLNYGINIKGRKIPEILFNVQYLQHGGDGALQLWEVPLVGDSIDINVIKTYKNTYMKQDDHAPLCENETIQYKISIF